MVVAYHGCDATTRDDLASGRLPYLTHSANKYDWLGPGAYFFEGDLVRALNFAISSYQNPLKLYTKQPIGTPAAVGAVLCLQRVLDMTTQAGIEEFSHACEAAEEAFDATGYTPVNRPASDDDVEIVHRAYDNAVFTFLHRVIKENEGVLYQAVRGAFLQGEMIGSSAFKRNTHIQLAVTDNSCVLGWFLPPGARQLSTGDYAAAKARQQEQLAIRRALKPRRKAP
ncbi:hypothetical protein [Massilia cavernae]|nr:hypothetical protein [Massilia cavernae]